MICHKRLTEKELEALMTGKIVQWENNPMDADAIHIEPPAHVRDSCAVSYSLHRAIVEKLEKQAKRTRDELAIADDTIHILRNNVAELREMQADEMAENLELFNVLGLTKPEDWGNKTATQAIIDRYREMESALSALRLKAGFDA